MHVEYKNFPSISSLGPTVKLYIWISKAFHVPWTRGIGYHDGGSAARAIRTCSHPSTFVRVWWCLVGGSGRGRRRFVRRHDDIFVVVIIIII